MNNSIFVKFSFLFTFTLVLTQLSFGQSRAVYSVNFTSVWNANDHGTLPDNAHWSKLVGVTHNGAVSFWNEGETASIGMQRIAEQGINTEFNDEVNAAISAGNADTYIDGDDLDTATGSIIITDLEVDESFSFLTLASMIAPSPDWMIAINSVPLREGGEWLPVLIVNLFVYDTGTDDGVNYDSPNAVTNPRGVITNKIGVFPFNSEKVGTMTITLQEILNVDGPQRQNTIKIYPNPSNGLLTISNQISLDISKIEVYNVLGKKEFQSEISASTNSVSVDLSALNSGIYILKMTSNNGQTRSQKLILE